jgi:hypothetical protein
MEDPQVKQINCCKLFWNLFLICACIYGFVVSPILIYLGSQGMISEKLFGLSIIITSCCYGGLILIGTVYICLNKCQNKKILCGNYEFYFC